MKKTALLVLLIFAIPSMLFAQEPFKTGYELYHNIKLMDDPQSVDNLTNVLYTTGYLAGIIDGAALMQDWLFKSISGNCKLKRINIPKGGLHTGQLILVFKNYAEKHPEKLNSTARTCVFLSLIEAYGWK